MIDFTLKVLWLSDMHFHSSYRDFMKQGPFMRFFSEFRQFVMESHQQRPFDLVLFSGDLAQQGTTKDYNALWDFFLSHIFDDFLASESTIPVPKFISIPGNHDVNWKNSAFMKDFLDSIHPSIEEPERRTLFFKDNAKKFVSLFADYTKFVTGISKKGMGRFKNFDFDHDDERKIVSTQYQAERLFGYVIDHDKNFIIILLNSAWFSLGGKFNIEFSKRSYNKYKGQVTRDKIREILDTANLLTEYNNQILGLVEFEFEALKEQLEIYSDYLIITAVHHPLNWVQWQEQYSYDSNGIGSALVLQSILKYSTILLTGHEHIPKEVPPEKISSNTLLLRGGCFLFDKQEANCGNLKNGWFSILDINADMGILTQERVYYESDRRTWHSEKKSFVLERKGFRKGLTEKRTENVKRHWDKIDIVKLKHFIKARGGRVNILEELKTEFDYCRIFSASVSAKPGPDEMKASRELYILVQALGFYQKIQSANFISFLDTYLEECDFQLDVIYFLIPDFYVSDNALAIYRDKSESTEGRYFPQHILAKSADAQFDEFRSHFFGRFEPPLQNKMEPVKPLFTKYYDLRFVNITVPFWRIGKFFPQNLDI